MQYDGSVWINTEMDSDGIVKGFERIKDGAGDVAVTVKKVGSVIEDAFSVAGNSSAVTTACRKLEDLTKSYADVGKQLEQEKQKLATLKEDWEYLSDVLDPLSDTGPKGFDLDLDTYMEYTEALKALPPEIEKQTAVVDKLEKEWAQASDSIEKSVKKVTQTVNQELDKQAEAAEKAAVRKEKAAKKEAAANQQAAESSLNSNTGSVSAEFQRASTAASNFGTRLKKLAAAAVVFDVIRRGLQGIVSYFGAALMANNRFANAVGKLKGSLMTAFQPIYEAVLPALIKLVEWLNYAIQAIGRFFAAMAGKDYDEMRKNAASLNDTINGTGDTMKDVADSTDGASDNIDNVGDSIEDTGEKAEEAEKSLAGFDEITRLLKDDSEDLFGTLDDLNKGNGFEFPEIEDNYEYPDISTGAPSFEEFTFPEEWAAAIEQLAMRIRDIFFEWENLTPEVVAEKLVTALTMLAGGLIGFTLAGFNGALIGMTVGAGLGVLLSSIIFDGDGKLSSEELYQSLVSVLSIVGGGLIGFAIGGPMGALIGVTVGAGLSIILSALVFNSDGNVSTAELISTLLNALIVIGGAAVGFTLGGPGGAVIGAAVGLGLSLILSNLEFNSDGNVSSDELVDELLVVLTTIAGGVIGFTAGGPGGAAIGATIGMGLSVVFSNMEFNAEGSISADELLNALVSALTAVAGGAIGFTVGGPGGAAIGATIGLGLSFEIVGTSFDEIEEEFNELQEEIGVWSEESSEEVEVGFISPTLEKISNWTMKVAEYFGFTKDTITETMSEAAENTETEFIEPTEEEFQDLNDAITADTEQTADETVDSWEEAGQEVKSNFVDPMEKEFDDLSADISNGSKSTAEDIKSTFGSLPPWLAQNTIQPANELFSGLANNILDVIVNVANAIGDIIADLWRSFGDLMEWISGGTSMVPSISPSIGMVPGLASYSITPDIPQLARGAVIPPNQKFLAVLGDQRHGTNVEAPLATIQEALRNELSDIIPAMIAGYEGVMDRQDRILEAVMGIDLDGETLSNAVNNYNRKMAVVRGG